MHRIERDLLKVELAVSLKTALGRNKTLLRPNRLPHGNDALCDVLAAAVIDLVDCDSRAVVQTETYGYSAPMGRDKANGASMSPLLRQLVKLRLPMLRLIT